MQGNKGAGAEFSGRGLKAAIVAARFHAHVVDSLLQGAVEALVEHDVERRDIDVLPVPGAWEIPLVAQQLAQTGQYDLLVTLGVVVRGETPHFDFVAGECARGLQDVLLRTGIPVGFGVLTTDDMQQALERAGGKVGNKGAEAALAALEVAVLLRGLAGRETMSGQ